MSDRATPKIGEIYRHFKGGFYKIVLLSICAETRESLVSYQDVNDESKIWTRPLSSFLDAMGDGREGTWFYRFELVTI